jgi:hypothetical protein
VVASDRTRKILWAGAGGRCSKCRVPLVTEGTDTDDPSVIGEEAHIISKQADGPRHTYLADYDVYDNLLLLCRNCHKPADDQWLHYTVEKLRLIKREHEAWVARRLASAPETDPIRLVPDPAFRIPKVMNLCMTGTQLWNVMQGAHMMYPSWPSNLTEHQNDLVADFLDNVHEWMDIGGMVGTFKIGRDAAKHLSELIKEMNEAGLFVGARRRHCLLTGGVGDPSPWAVFDIEFCPVMEAMMVDVDGQPLVDDKGERIWPPASTDPGGAKVKP